jgi:D-amino peptidase
MKVLISIDMEGIAGVVKDEHVMLGDKAYERFRVLMTAEANAAIEGALAGGATKIVVNDSHGKMTNVLIEELNPAAELITGSPKPFGMMQGIGCDVDAVFFIGYHAASGTHTAVQEHTCYLDMVEVSLNGSRVGETGLNAALAGHYEVPVVLVTGDRAVTQEARALLGDIETVSTKDGITRWAARCLHPEVAQKLIREGAERALKARGRTFRLSTPITLRISFLRATNADMAELIPYSRRIDGRTVEWEGEDMALVYRVFRAMGALAMTVDTQLP